MRSVPDFLSKGLCIPVVAGLMMCGLLGCESSFECEGSLPEGPSLTPRVTLAPGDTVEVRFFYTPELNVTQAVRPDGKIALQLVGDVPVHGKTPEELRKELLTLYRPHLKEPDVAVIVQSFYHRRVFVGGQVLKPGVIQMPGQLTALDAIMEAGGFQLPQAEVRNVIVIRHQNEHRYGYCIDLKPALKGGQVRPFYLEAQDVVYVPQTRITEIGQWVDQHINNLLPKTGLVVLTSTGETTIGYDLR
jgi:protein involved in polysaccharide export with SLBB domain